AAETHIVVPLFKNITTVVDGSPVLVPRTLESIDQLDKSSGGVGCRYIYNGILEDKRIEPAEEFHYAVLTKDLLPGSRGKNYAAHKALVESKGYEMPPVLDVVTAILWENRRTGERLLGDNPLTYTRCREKIEEWRPIVGGFAPGGLDVCKSRCDRDSVGVVGFRKF
ncbi:MAG: hypothetical protein KR126chlam3_00204, partial [Chlamydiae bacterium]|nr:hypothetical protein [Chlamydiota bacterium]